MTIIIRDEINQCLEEICKEPNKKSNLCRQLAKFVNYEISMLRYTYWVTKPSRLAQMCNRAANYLEKRLKYSLGIGVN